MDVVTVYIYMYCVMYSDVFKHITQSRSIYRDTKHILSIYVQILPLLSPASIQDTSVADARNVSAHSHITDSGFESDFRNRRILIKLQTDMYACVQKKTCSVHVQMSSCRCTHTCRGAI